MFAIENDKPNWGICQLAVEDIDELTERIGNVITGGYFHKLRKRQGFYEERLRLDGEIQKVPPRSPHASVFFEVRDLFLLKLFPSQKVLLSTNPMNLSCIF